jgi:hypothetical protein
MVLFLVADHITFLVINCHYLLPPSLPPITMQMIKRHVVNEIIDHAKFRVALFLMRRQRQVWLHVHTYICMGQRVCGALVQSVLLIRGSTDMKKL